MEKNKGSFCELLFFLAVLVFILVLPLCCTCEEEIAADLPEQAPFSWNIPQDPHWIHHNPTQDEYATGDCDCDAIDFDCEWEDSISDDKCAEAERRARENCLCDDENDEDEQDSEIHCDSYHADCLLLEFYCDEANGDRGCDEEREALEACGCNLDPPTDPAR